MFRSPHKLKKWHSALIWRALIAGSLVTEMAPIGQLVLDGWLSAAMERNDRAGDRARDPSENLQLRQFKVHITLYLYISGSEMSYP